MCVVLPSKCRSQSTDTEVELTEGMNLDKATFGDSLILIWVTLWINNIAKNSTNTHSSI